MAQPPNKKQKTAGPAAPPPIVFQSPGIQPDVRLKVFNTEFHVHSTILKLYSAFFRKFLDSPDKAQVTAEPANLSISTRMPIAPTRFKYEWVTKMDDDISEEEQTTNDAIGWYLVAITVAAAHEVSNILSIYYQHNESSTVSYNRQKWSK